MILPGGHAGLDASPPVTLRGAGRGGDHQRRHRGGPSWRNTIRCGLHREKPARWKNPGQPVPPCSSRCVSARHPH
ncbi:hypothetical protein ACU4GD_32535 [Cupriavidus basilensis]